MHFVHKVYKGRKCLINRTEKNSINSVNISVKCIMDWTNARKRETIYAVIHNATMYMSKIAYTMSHRSCIMLKLLCTSSVGKSIIFNMNQQQNSVLEYFMHVDRHSQPFCYNTPNNSLWVSIKKKYRATSNINNISHNEIDNANQLWLWSVFEFVKHTK